MRRSPSQSWRLQDQQGMHKLSQCMHKAAQRQHKIAQVGIAPHCVYQPLTISETFCVSLVTCHYRDFAKDARRVVFGTQLVFHKCQFTKYVCAELDESSPLRFLCKGTASTIYIYIYIHVQQMAMSRLFREEKIREWALILGRPVPNFKIMRVSVEPVLRKNSSMTDLVCFPHLTGWVRRAVCNTQNFF